MSYNKYPTFGNTKKDQQDRSKKPCVCGGHNIENAKKNLNHNSTKTKLIIRSKRISKKLFKEANFIYGP